MNLNEAAAALGRRGGSKTSERKAASSRANLERARVAKRAAQDAPPEPPQPEPQQQTAPAPGAPRLLSTEPKI